MRAYFRIIVLASAFPLFMACAHAGRDSSAAQADTAQMRAKCAAMMNEKAEGGKGMMREKGAENASMMGCRMMAEKKPAEPATKPTPENEDHSEHHPKP